MPIQQGQTRARPAMARHAVLLHAAGARLDGDHGQGLGGAILLDSQREQPVPGAPGSRILGAHPRGPARLLVGQRDASAGAGDSGEGL